MPAVGVEEDPSQPSVPTLQQSDGRVPLQERYVSDTHTLIDTLTDDKLMSDLHLLRTAYTRVQGNDALQTKKQEMTVQLVKHLEETQPQSICFLKCKFPTRDSQQQ